MSPNNTFEELLRKKGIHMPMGAVLTRRNEPGPYKLSFAQHRIWFLQQFENTSAAYNDPTALQIIGPLNVIVLERALNEIMRRHDVLRMVFPAPEGQPIQVLLDHENAQIAITIILLNKWYEESSGKPGTEPGTDIIREFVNWFSSRPFDLSRDLLVRAALLKIGEEEHVLVVNIHHIVMDGWSKGIILQELMALYETLSNETPSTLGELPFQYTDYVHWHHEWIQGKIFESQMAYWKEKLKGAPPTLELPLDYPRPNLPSGKGSLELFSVSMKKLQALNHLARQEEVTLFMVLVSVYNILLYRYSGKEDILIGVPVAGRQRVELEKLIGLFVNTFIIRTDLAGRPTFKTLLGRVRAAALEAYAHQDIPFEKLVEELNPQRNLSITPLFQVMFQLQNAPMPPARIQGLTITPIQINTGFSQTDLSLTMWEEEGIMKGTFEYNTDLFTAGTINRMAGHFQELLDDIIAITGVDRDITQLSMLTETERREILEIWNSTGFDYPKELNIQQMFSACAAQHANEPAVIFEDKQLTYAGLRYQAGQLADFLRKNGAGPETLAAICMENSLALIVGVMAILMTGAAYIPMDPTYPDERLMAILNDACPPVLITTKAGVNRFEKYAGKIICLDEETDFAASNTDYMDEGQTGHAACVIYTSGSTGEPKGILIENRNIVNLVYSFIESYKPGPGDRILPLTSIASASFVGEILPILCSGGAIYLADRISILDIKNLKSLINEQHITILSTVPSLIARLNSGDWESKGLRLLLSGGEALSAGDIDHLIKKVTIVNGYGLTEATVCSTYTIVNEIGLDFSKYPAIPVGKPIINTQIYILDKNNNVVPIGVPGEIYIGGAGISRGYLNNPGLTNDRFILPSGTGATRNPFEKGFLDFPKLLFNHHSPLTTHHSPLYKTGDLGSWQPDGNIKFLGRIDTQVQVHGYRIELAEIETHLGLHPDIEDVVVTIVEPEGMPGDKRLAAYLVPVKVDENGQKRILPSSNQLREWLGKRIPGYMIPAVFEIVDTIPLNTNGKVDFSVLPKPSWDRSGLDVDFKAPQTEVEKTITSVWQEFLHLDKIGINDNFFDIGGHSLLLTQIHSRLNEIYQDKQVTIVDLFRFPTIYALAKYIEKNKQKVPISYGKTNERAKKQKRSYEINKKHSNRRS